MLRLPRAALRRLLERGFVVALTLAPLGSEGAVTVRGRVKRWDKPRIYTGIRYRLLGKYINDDEHKPVLRKLLKYTGYRAIEQVWGAYHVTNDLTYNVCVLYRGDRRVIIPRALERR